MSIETFNKLIKFLKTIRMGWVVPFILLAKGENPSAQIRAIFSGVCIPIFAILAFLYLWNTSSSLIVTKFGTVPGPRQVLSAWGSLRNESRLEEIKEADHVRRLREKRVDYSDKYSETLKDLPGGAPDFGDPAENAKALAAAALVFGEVNELLDVSNKISISRDGQSARETAESFEFEPSKAFASVVIDRLLPMEIAFRKADETFRMSTDYDVLKSDSKEIAARKKAARHAESKRLAAEKAALLIRRQEITTLATWQALARIDSVPSGTMRVLDSIDAASVSLRPKLDAWFTAIEEAEAAGTKYRNKTKVKMLNKSFADNPYPGKETYVQQIGTSLKTVFAGFLIASLIAIPLGVVCGLNKNINNAFNPLIQIFKPVSPLAWLPIVMIVVGALYTPDDPMFELSFINSAITVALCSLWPTLVNTAVGVASTDKDFLNVAKVLKLNWFKKIFKVVLPAALPLVFTGLRLSLGVGWMVLIAAEMLAQNPGLGKFVWDMFQNGSSETLSMIMVAVFTIGIIGFALDTVMLSLQQFVSFGENEAI